MRKIVGFISIALIIASSIGACSGDSYAKRLKSEKRAIANFIATKELKVEYGIPKDSVFMDNIYYRDSETGIYMCILDMGVGKKARPFVPGKHSGTKVSMNLDSIYSLKAGGDTISTLAGSALLGLTYGQPATYTGNTSNPLSYYYLSASLAFPLQFVSDSAVVSLIVPFDFGSLQQGYTYEPYYYGTIRYKFTDY